MTTARTTADPHTRLGRAATMLALGIGLCAAPGASSAQMVRPPRAQPAAAAPSADCARTLPNIQRCITSAAVASFRANDTAALAAVAASLRSGLATDKGQSLYYRSYWLAYADYVIADLALAGKHPDQARTAVLEADTLLDKLATKNEESYALQDLTLLFRFAIAQPTEIGGLLSRTAELRSKLADTTSVRALYALALADFYTPKQYGGGRQAEGLLRKALAMPDEPSSPLKPTWGRDECAALLVRVLRQAGSTDQAAKLYDEWHAKYPDSIALAQLPSPS